jgi:methyltransferase (TIGR00027 family)
MEAGRPSSTAVAVAMWRAAHLLLDEEPKILRDELALPLSGADSEATFRATLEAVLADVTRQFGAELTQRVFTYLRAWMTMRSRYTEDELGRALERGVRQYVILGAGLDSFAYRRPDLARVVHVFEVDYPATQRWKQQRLQELQLAVPPNLTCIPLDFERQSLTEGLLAGGYRQQEAAFFSWLGVTQYLTTEAVFQTLRAVAAMAPGSEIVFEYWLPDALLDEETQQVMTMVKRTSAARGEPWLSAFEPAQLAARVKELSFSQVWDLSPEEATARYFANRTDGLRLLNSGHLLKARVGQGVPVGG